ncbi:embryonic polarity protein dorsal-like isoform X2 [Aethina tumida]|nr:embryonic polarity protein dorsal-like isoform X2 [Aethina tumida]
MRDENINISDVIEVIETDLEFREVPARPASPTATAINNATMFNGGGEISNYHLPKQPQTASTSSRSQRAGYRIEIIEQPAQKALRFRYECEGRSAGSIPGASSTPENKTFPAIKVVGGPPRKAVVVVSCVTKDHPYRPHPHKLVGREGCKRGVCTLEIPPETMSVSFSNLGIQCVKKKDIEEALRVREEIRVDPFKTGFSHRNQPTSIDLNTVRLCFQVFLENENQTGKYTVQLDPKVSDPICDKKAMSDLNIVMLSDAVSPCNGGKLVILLCEKVAKEDIQVRFYDDADGWETFAEIQPAQVHKQHAIWFKTPAYKRVDIVDKVRVQVQLRRPSDGSVSDSRPFEFWPLNSGRPSFWTYRRHMAKKGNLSLLDSILSDSPKYSKDTDKPPTETAPVLPPKPNILQSRETNILLAEPVTIVQEQPQETIILSPEPQTVAEPWADYAEVQKIKEIAQNNNNNNTEEKSFNELINQVAELDEIYADTQARLLNQDLTNVEKPTLAQIPQNESFDDAKTYTSLQLAFKNPLELELSPEPPLPPVIPPHTHKRENPDEKLPPLPPKRSKKIETYIGGSMTSIQLTGKQAENLLHRSNSTLRGVPVSRSQSFNLHRPKSQVEVFADPNKQLPPTPNYSTLPNPKKRGFFSKLFGRKSKTPSASREPSVTPSAQSNSLASSKSLQVQSNLGKSSGNISTHSANSIRIPLKDSTENLSKPEVSKDVPEDMDMNLDLTEAEHYALYTAIAPHATQSEFDEMSCYYAPVEGGKLLTHSEVLARLQKT